MTDNIFMISDASYSNITNCAGLGVIDLNTNKKYSHSISDVKSSYVAEYKALCLSVNIAIQNNYNNVVFVYDNQSLKLDTLKLWLVDKILSYQFLWLKRAYLDNADKLAKKARTLYENLIINKISSPVVTNTNILQVFKRYSKRKILLACIKIANKNERIILSTYIKNEKYPPILIHKDSIDFYSDIYHLLSRTDSKSQKSYLKFIDKNYAQTIDMNTFLTVKSDEYYINLINKIIAKLTLPKQTIKKISKKKNDINLIESIQKYHPKKIVNFCAVIGSEHDKKLLDGYFNCKKINRHTIDYNGIQLYMLIYTLIPQTIKNNFYKFIKNRINDKELEKVFIKAYDIDFQTTMLKKVIAKQNKYNLL